MNLSLDPNLQRLITDRVNSGKYATPEEVITAALHSLEHEEHAGEFGAGEWDDLLVEGEKSGEALDGETVLTELRKLRADSAPKNAG